MSIKPSDMERRLIDEDYFLSREEVEELNQVLDTRIKLLCKVLIRCRNDLKRAQQELGQYDRGEKKGLIP